MWLRKAMARFGVPICLACPFLDHPLRALSGASQEISLDEARFFMFGMSQKEVCVTVFIAYVQQPALQEGAVRIEVFADREAAVSWLRAEFDRFSHVVPRADIRTFGTDAGDNVAAGVVRAGYTSWSGRVVARELQGPPPAAAGL